MDVSHLGAAPRQAEADLRRMSSLHGLAVRLSRAGETRRMLADVLRVALEVTGAEMGNLQRIDQGVLTIAAQEGFEPPFLEFFGRVEADSDCTCGVALMTQQRVVVEDVADSPIFVNTPAHAVMLTAQIGACQSTPLFDAAGHFLGVLSTHYRAPHRFDPAELQWLDLLAQHAALVLDHEWRVRQSEGARLELKEQVDERTRWLSLMHDVSRVISEASTWDEALHQVLRCVCAAEQWQIGFVYLPDPDSADFVTPVVSYSSEERFSAFQEVSQEQRYERGQFLPGRVYAENVPMWIDEPEALARALPVRAGVARKVGLRAAVALPITQGNDVLAVLELLSNEPHPHSEQLAALIRDIGDQIARVVERESITARVADLIWREQQSLLHTLHDSVGQTLTGLGMLSTSLGQRLAEADPENARSAAEIATYAQQALEQVRQLARSLFPVDVDAANLLSALRDLAATTESLYGIHTRVEGRPSEELLNGKVATELYRIAQEAVTNVVKHGRARTIHIRLIGRPRLLELQVLDDGVGLSNSGSTDGMGLRIMRYRAASIGARLTVGPGPTGGTIVECRLRSTPRLEHFNSVAGASSSSGERAR
jgi:signal transduction histidine kinase